MPELLLCSCGRDWYNTDNYRTCYLCYLDRRADYLNCIFCDRWHSPRFEACYQCRAHGAHREDAALTLRNYILWRDDYTCRHCGSHRDLHIDHIIPCRRDGTASPWNLQVLCRDCNIAKADNWPPDDDLNYRTTLFRYYFHDGRRWLNEEQRTDLHHELRPQQKSNDTNDTNIRDWSPDEIEALYQPEWPNLFNTNGRTWPHEPLPQPEPPPTPIATIHTQNGLL